MRWFSKGELQKIHTHYLDIIENCGVRFPSERALKILDGEGRRNRVEVARSKVIEILTEHKPKPLAENVRREMQEILEAYQDKE